MCICGYTCPISKPSRPYVGICAGEGGRPHMRKCTYVDDNFDKSSENANKQATIVNCTITVMFDATHTVRSVRSPLRPGGGPRVGSQASVGAILTPKVRAIQLSRSQRLFGLRSPNFGSVLLRSGGFVWGYPHAKIPNPSHSLDPFTKGVFWCFLPLYSL